jgi:sugar lactone lactonase YvrE
MNMKFKLSFAALSALALAAGCAQPMAPFQSGTVRAVTGSDAMKDPLPVVMGGPARGHRAGNLELVATFHSNAQLVGVAVSKTGRTFVLFPRWADKSSVPLAELSTSSGAKLTPFPDGPTNTFDPNDPEKYDVRTHLVSPQAITFDSQDRLWILDPGSINFAPNLLNGPKLWCYDINTKTLVKDIRFPTDVAMKMTALNDVRIDLRAGKEGVAYITDSGVGGIIVVDLASGFSWRHLDGHPSVLPTPGLQQMTEGRPFVQHKPSGEMAAPDFRSDGIALSPDGSTLYYNSVVSRDVWAVPTALLLDPKSKPDTVAAAVKRVASKPSGNDGMLCDPEGHLLTTDFEDNAIRHVDPASGSSTVLAQDERLIWPDSLAMSGGYVYVTVNQLPRGADYNGGKDKRVAPWSLWKIRMTEAGNP